MSNPNQSKGKQEAGTTPERHKATLVKKVNESGESDTWEKNAKTFDNRHKKDPYNFTNDPRLRGLNLTNMDHQFLTRLQDNSGDPARQRRQEARRRLFMAAATLKAGVSDPSIVKQILFDPKEEGSLDIIGQFVNSKRSEETIRKVIRLYEQDITHKGERIPKDDSRLPFIILWREVDRYAEAFPNTAEANPEIFGGHLFGPTLKQSRQGVVDLYMGLWTDKQRFSGVSYADSDEEEEDMLARMSGRDYDREEDEGRVSGRPEDYEDEVPTTRESTSTTTTMPSNYHPGNIRDNLPPSVESRTAEGRTLEQMVTEATAAEVSPDTKIKSVHARHVDPNSGAAAVTKAVIKEAVLHERDAPYKGYVEKLLKGKTQENTEKGTLLKAQGEAAMKKVIKQAIGHNPALANDKGRKPIRDPGNLGRGVYANDPRLNSILSGFVRR